MEHLNPANLKRLPRTQLVRLLQETLALLATLHEAAPERPTVLANLAAIRRALAAPNPSPG